jgi:hypothetical protein
MAINKIINVGVLTDDTRKIINDNFRDISRCSTQFSLTSSTTLANVVGLTSGTLQPGIYEVDINLITTANASGGVKAALKWGTASMITNTALSVTALSAAAVAATTFTTSTDAASMVAGTAAYVNVKVKGTITVALAGTITLQAAQNASNGAATTVEVGSTMSFTAIGATTPLATAAV